MRLITSVEEMRSYTREWRVSRSLGLVPTMGALHAGHLSLVRRARSECDVVVVSIFVNPTQFGVNEDFGRYPRDLERDIDALVPYHVDAVFAPAISEIYPPGFESCVDPGPIAGLLEGASRPGHFRGVATVVVKLFNTVSPDVAYFGQKDFQQAVIIHHVVRDLNLGVCLAVSPVVRDPDGLALSSRNVYLSPNDRKAALALYHSLLQAREVAEASGTDANKILEEMHKVLAAEPRVQLDYAVIVEPVGFHPVEHITSGSVALVAARIGPTRLIDNMILRLSGQSENEWLDRLFGGRSDQGTRTLAADNRRAKLMNSAVPSHSPVPAFMP